MSTAAQQPAFYACTGPSPTTSRLAACASETGCRRSGCWASSSASAARPCGEPSPSWRCAASSSAPSAAARSSPASSSPSRPTRCSASRSWAAPRPRRQLAAARSCGAAGVAPGGRRLRHRAGRAAPAAAPAAAAAGRADRDRRGAGAVRARAAAGRGRRRRRVALRRLPRPGTSRSPPSSTSWRSPCRTGRYAARARARHAPPAGPHPLARRCGSPAGGFVHRLSG